MTVRSVDESGSFTFTPPVAQWKNTCTPLCWAAAQTGSKSAEWYGWGGIAGRRIPRNPAAATRSISATASSTSVMGTGAVGASREKYGVKRSMM